MEFPPCQGLMTGVGGGVGGDPCDHDCLNNESVTKNPILAS